jgi:hypothetical protein
VAGWDIPRQRFSKGGSAEFIFEDHANVSGIIMVAKNVAQHRSRGFTKQRRLEEETPVSSYPESANTIRLAQYHHLALYFRRDSADMTSNAKLIYMLAKKKYNLRNVSTFPASLCGARTEKILCPLLCLGRRHR